MIHLGHVWQALMIGLALYAISPVRVQDDVDVVWTVDRGGLAVA